VGAADGVTRLYLDDPYLREFDAEVTGSADGWCVLSRTAFHPGGGGQPHDQGRLTVRDASI
jgi:Ser-tRNA(Ala) deacylase AlaX